MKLTAYRHEVGEPSVDVDPRPGRYYVSAVDGERKTLLAGPLASHAVALALVPRVRALAEEVDPRAVWWAFGTARLHDDALEKVGALNARLQDAGVWQF